GRGATQCSSKRCASARDRSAGSIPTKSGLSVRCWVLGVGLSELSDTGIPSAVLGRAADLVKQIMVAADQLRQSFFSQAKSHRYHGPPRGSTETSSWSNTSPRRARSGLKGFDPFFLGTPTCSTNAVGSYTIRL